MSPQDPPSTSGDGARRTWATTAQSDADGLSVEALAHVGSWGWDAAADAVRWSDELYRIHGCHPRDFGGDLAAHLAAIVAPERHTVEAAIRAALGDGVAFEQKNPIQRSDGEQRWLYCRAGPLIGRDNQPSGLRGICQDITDRHRVQEATRQAYERERAAADELRSADAVKDEFLATVSHELRTPLTAIMGFAGLLEYDAAAEQRDLIGRISRNASEMSQMIERLLDFSRLEAGKVAFEAEPMPLREHIESQVEYRQDVLGGHRVVIDVPGELAVVADSDALERIVGNLLGNAAKFSPAGSAITLSAVADRSWVTVSVHDEGRGVPEELRERVFERFFQAPGHPAGKRGTGVGLAIAARYVELHGGTIWCEGALGGGATFSFTLPAARAT